MWLALGSSPLGATAVGPAESREAAAYCSLGRKPEECELSLLVFQPRSGGIGSSQGGRGFMSPLRGSKESIGALSPRAGARGYIIPPLCGSVSARRRPNIPPHSEALHCPSEYMPWPAAISLPCL